MINNTITVNAYAKINLSIDVLGKLENGYHEVEMVMQQIALRDKVTITIEEKSQSGEREILLVSNKKWLPVDQSNIAFKAACLIADRYRPDFKGTIAIDLQKGIPVAAGLAGGSADGAAVLRGLRQLWNLPVSFKTMLELGLSLGADVPFCLMGQEAAGSLPPGNTSRRSGGNSQSAEQPDGLARQMRQADSQEVLHSGHLRDHRAGTCALAQGIGEKLTPVKPLDALVLLSKPKYSASTAAVYNGLNLNAITERPDTVSLLEGLKENNLYKVTSSMGNVLQPVTSALVPQVEETRKAMAALPGAAKVLMSGSGPTVFAIFTSRKKAEAGLRKMEKINRETYLVRTLL